MDIGDSSGEIERLFSLDELDRFEPRSPRASTRRGGSTNAKGFVHARAHRPLSELDALDALVEAVIGSRSDADPRLRDMKPTRLQRRRDARGGRLFGRSW